MCGQTLIYEKEMTPTDTAFMGTWLTWAEKFHRDFINHEKKETLSLFKITYDYFGI